LPIKVKPLLGKRSVETRNDASSVEPELNSTGELSLQVHRPRDLARVGVNEAVDLRLTRLAFKPRKGLLKPNAFGVVGSDIRLICSSRPWRE
jgi:hypothetical protein